MQGRDQFKMPNVAIFGGTFNPVHWGHLLIAETAIDQFQLDRVIWVPAVHPPHKAQSLLAFEHRLAMVRHAIADQPAFTVSAVAEPQGTSYAIATLNALQALEPDACWHWLIGNDAFQTLPKWRASQDLAARCIWLVAPRCPSQPLQESSEPSTRAAVLAHPHPAIALPQLCWHVLEMPTVALSSSLIRQRCREGRSIRSLVPETVRDYIVRQNLYRMS